MKTSPTASSYTPRISTLTLVTISIALAVYVLSLRTELRSLQAELAVARLDRDAARKDEEVSRAQLVPLQENVARLAAENDSIRSGSPGAAGENGQGTASIPKYDQLPG